MTQSEIVTREADYAGLQMAISPTEALRRVQELQAFVAQVMTKGTDYGVIPGTGDKPTLLQPGAQKLAEIYGLAIHYEDVEATCDWNGQFFMFRKRCVLTDRRDGRFICDGVGSCNSREDRYAGRWVFDRQLPQGVDKKGLRTRSLRNGGIQYRVPNEDVCSLVNTFEKMACKRSLVHAIIGATRSSGIFTQDVEDLPAEVFGEAHEARSWARPATAKGSVPHDPETGEVLDATAPAPELPKRVKQALRDAKEFMHPEPAPTKSRRQEDIGVTVRCKSCGELHTIGDPCPRCGGAEQPATCSNCGGDYPAGAKCPCLSGKPKVEKCKVHAFRDDVCVTCGVFCGARLATWFVERIEGADNDRLMRLAKGVHEAKEALGQPHYKRVKAAIEFAIGADAHLGDIAKQPPPGAGDAWEPGARS